ncbi:MAG: endonuclease domain-containing protein [Bacteroidota bacterium]
MKQIINHPEKKKNRRKLRNNLTPAEATLWLSLKNKQLDGRRFKRQVSFGPYIVDFYCPSEKLVIEVDGPYHEIERKVRYDKKRERYLEKLGLRVIRFKNKKVFDKKEELLQEIKRHFQPPCVPPLKRGAAGR